jgi:hypothetical protein
MIFYAFYKFQQFTTTIEDALLRLDPWNFPQSHNNTPTLHKTPREEKWRRNWVPGHGGGAAQPIPARPAALPAGQGRGEKSKLTKGPLELKTWRGGTLRRRTAMTGGDGHGGRNSGECNARGQPHAMLGAPGGSMDGAQTIWWLGRLGLVLGDDGVHGGRRGKGGAARHGAHRSGQ